MGTKRKSTTDYTREVSNKIISSNNQKNSNVEVHSRLLSSENSFVAYHHYHPLPQQQQQQQQQQLEGDCAVTTGTGSTGSSANARERARMRVISHAFVRLKTTLPWVPADTKLSKLDTLRLATSYIAHLRHVLNADQSGCSSDVTTIPAVKHTTSPPAINPMTLVNYGLMILKYEAKSYIASSLLNFDK
jgi:hypothetical protein